jgi:hypothetical protein
MGNRRSGAIYKACTLLVVLLVLMLVVGFLTTLVGPNLIGDTSQETELRWWLTSPKSWHAHPFALVWGLVATGMGAVAAAVVFWVKGRYWP